MLQGKVSFFGEASTVGESGSTSGGDYRPRHISNQKCVHISYISDYATSLDRYDS